MKKVLFASTALAALAIGGAASAQGITLFGDARLGLKYEEDAENELTATSRARFGVRMTGTTNSGITFGATIRADQAGRDSDTRGNLGQAGSAFVSGAFGSLTYGDTNAADEQHVGDVPGNYSLTGLGDFNETPFLTNGGSYGDAELARTERPTARYDYNFGDFGFSFSSNQRLSDAVIGASYNFQFAGGSFKLGAGYADMNESTIGDFETFSVGVNGTFGDFEGGVTYINHDGDLFEGESILVGAGFGFNEWTFGAFYHEILTADDNGIGLVDVDGETPFADYANLDGGDAYGFTAQYDLGGGASINGGIVNRVSDDNWTGDFGIKMSF